MQHHYTQIFKSLHILCNKGLLDIQQLLLANSKIHALTLTQLEEAQKQSQEAEFNLHKSEQRYVESLQKEKTLALEEFILSVQREVTSPAKLVVGNERSRKSLYSRINPNGRSLPKVLSTTCGRN